MSTPATLMVDADDPTLVEYNKIVMPPLWTLVVGDPGPLSDIYNRSFAANPDLDWYGILCDDVVPETLEWDLNLIEAAGSDGMAIPEGGHHATIAPHFVLGGDLVRELGWLSLPGLDRIYIDTVWSIIAHDRGVHRYLPDVQLTHLHFSNGKAPMDATYRKHHKERDRQIYQAWKDAT